MHLRRISRSIRLREKAFSTVKEVKVLWFIRSEKTLWMTAVYLKKTIRENDLISDLLIAILQIESRETLNEKGDEQKGQLRLLLVRRPFGRAGAYEKIVHIGQVGLDQALLRNNILIHILRRL